MAPYEAPNADRRLAKHDSPPFPPGFGGHIWYYSARKGTLYVISLAAPHVRLPMALYIAGGPATWETQPPGKLSTGDLDN
jgi:hypothetical protein